MPTSTTGASPLSGRAARWSWSRWAGITDVLSSQGLIGPLALDLFAVLFGGAIALFPIFATDILTVGATGFGLLNAAPAIGALTVMFVSMKYPPKRYAGRLLHV